MPTSGAVTCEYSRRHECVNHGRTLKLIASTQWAMQSTVCAREFMCNIYACNLHGQASIYTHGDGGHIATPTENNICTLTRRQSMQSRAPSLS